MGPCLGRPSDPPGNLSGVVFGATKIQRLFTHRESSGTQNHYKRLSNPNLTQEFQVAFLNQFMNNSSVLEKETTFKWEAIRCLVGGCIGRIRMYKKYWYTKLLLYTNEFSRLPCVIWSVKELVVHPKKKKKKKNNNNNSGGPDLTLNKLFWGFSLSLRQKKSL